jgi:hypothetical protein
MGVSGIYTNLIEMKIALCLHGLFNSETDSTSNGIDGFEYIKENIFTKGDVDTYIHSWELDKQEEILKLYKPKIYKFEKQKDFLNIINDRGLDNLTGTPRPIKSVISHLYSVTESINLALTNETYYDVVIKSRFDLGRINRNTSGPDKHNPFPVQCIHLLTKIEQDKIYMANWNHFNMGPADMWFYGSTNIMGEFKNLFDFLKKEMYIDSEYHKFATSIQNNKGDLSNSIAFYKYWMMKNGLWDKKVALNTLWS